MVKAASKGKIANKVSSKKNKKHLSGQNKTIFKKSDNAKIGSKGELGLTTQIISKGKKKGKNEKNRIDQSIKQIAERIKNDDFVLPEDDMISTDEEGESLGFLDSLTDSRQIQKLEKERKRRKENEGEDFEIQHRR